MTRGRRRRIATYIIWGRIALTDNSGRNAVLETEANAEGRIQRAARFKVCDGQSVVLTVERADGGDSAPTQATLVDISTGGVKLSLAAPLRLHEVFSLTIGVPKCGLDLTVVAEVCWLRQAGLDRWTAGCSFSPELSPEALKTLIDGRLIDQRAFVRSPVMIAAQAQWELDPVRFDVTLEDVSEGGIRLRGPRGGKTGTRLVVFIKGPDGQEIAVAAKSRWQISDGPSFTVGTAFINAQGYAAIHDILALRPIAESPAGRRRWFAFWRR